jgi:2'-5' RNA ligase
MRLFVAIDVEDEARDAIVREQKRLGQLLSRAQPRWALPEQIHLTLTFIGEIDSARLTPIVDAMSRDFARAPFRLVFGGLGVFPAHGAPRVLWIGVSEGEGRVVELQEDVARRLAAVGVTSDERPFRPHLTLGRWRDGRPSDRSRVAAAAPAPISGGSVEAVTLYESRLSPSGATHIPVARGRLVGG